MQFVPNSLFAFPQMQQLLDDERQLIERRVARLADGAVLSIDPLACSRPVLAAAGKQASRLHVAGESLIGDARCAADALPWAAESFQIVIARHVVDSLPIDSGIEAELARVLAPGGTLMVSGLNPFSPWRLWWSRACRDGSRVTKCRSPHHAQRTFETHGLSFEDRAFIGGSWPPHDVRAREMLPDERGSRWHGAWLLVVKKRAAAVRPIPLRSATRRRAALGPAFVPSSSGRLRA